MGTFRLRGHPLFVFYICLSEGKPSGEEIIILSPLLWICIVLSAVGERGIERQVQGNGTALTQSVSSYSHDTAASLLEFMEIQIFIIFELS